MASARSVPRVVCCAIPIRRADKKILVITSRNRPGCWGPMDRTDISLAVPKGGWENTDGSLEAAASREALEEAGVRGRISKYVTTVPTASVTYHFYELDVSSLDNHWLESHERRREWVDYAEAERRVAWKPELAQGLRLSSLASGR